LAGKLNEQSAADQIVQDGEDGKPERAIWSPAKYLADNLRPDLILLRKLSLKNTSTCTSFVHSQLLLMLFTTN
jgi:hypothetical protein